MSLVQFDQFFFNRIGQGDDALADGLCLIIDEKRNTPVDRCRHDALFKRDRNHDFLAEAFANPFGRNRDPLIKAVHDEENAFPFDA